MAECCPRSFEKYPGGNDMTALSLNNNNSSPSLIGGGFLSQTQSRIDGQQLEDAVCNLCNSLSLAEIRPCYHSLFEILPVCNEEQFRKLNTNLPLLLERSPPFFAEQRKLS